MSVSANSDSNAKPAQGAAAAAEPRQPISLAELIEMLVRAKVITAQNGKDLEARATTLRRCFNAAANATCWAWP